MRTLKSAMLGCALVLPIAFGATMARAADIVDTAVAAGSFKTLVAAVQAAGLVDTLKGKGPFTVFAPTDEAFAKLPPGTVENLVQPQNKATLTKILTYHVVAGKMNAADIIAAAQAAGGKATLTTVEGQPLTAWKDGDAVYLQDAKGGTSKVTIADVNQSNGVIHVIDTVLMP